VGSERLREIMAELVNCASSVVQGYGGTVVSAAKLPSGD
jgi:hypothetical protein